MGLIGTTDERPAATSRRRHGRSSHRRRCHGDIGRLLPYVAVRTPELGGDAVLVVEDTENRVTLNQLLMFLTGADRVPPLGFPGEPTINFLHTVTVFPEANTSSERVSGVGGGAPGPESVRCTGSHSRGVFRAARGFRALATAKEQFVYCSGGTVMRAFKHWFGYNITSASHFPLTVARPTCYASTPHQWGRHTV
ncbi:unnamed protein product [Pleuronectes platessa]|uniref:Uncharacterized protein n=1 Tax=Pleuronectes platessa TaxID=8262 RepID=A0A9N7U9M1_PLEPL|nr:unnamed protein product [Pleuronectes platessa]